MSTRYGVHFKLRIKRMYFSYISTRPLSLISAKCYKDNAALNQNMYARKRRSRSQPTECLTAFLLPGPPRQCSCHWWIANGLCRRENSHCEIIRIISDATEKTMGADVRYTLDEVRLVGDFSTLIDRGLLRTRRWPSAPSPMCVSVVSRPRLTSQVLQASHRA
jgi:hypothetical protein